jgi:hypothetical protein
MPAPNLAGDSRWPQWAAKVSSLVDVSSVLVAD